MAETEAGQPIVTGRSCGSCTLCCKVKAIEELDKPMSKWCPHCQPGRGCKIYEDRPPSCRGFHCEWLVDEKLGEEWKPSKSKMVIEQDASASSVCIHVDHQAPGAWRAEPYYAQIKHLASLLTDKRWHVVVSVNRHMHVIAPDRDIDLGFVSQDHVLVVSWQGARLSAEAMHQNDPRILAVSGRR